ncbi:hypothetical protein CBPV_s1gp2 [Chronic bee paralysis virus]|uniref:hypothetical protein n=1 Tax=Chronic bee paralysis virus TaxID=180822 RepID=UPI0001750240|nr:hypothetical protein CBPV_s1gp2 [Chronic bee paralysis virus]
MSMMFFHPCHPHSALARAVCVKSNTFSTPHHYPHAYIIQCMTGSIHRYIRSQPQSKPLILTLASKPKPLLRQSLMRLYQRQLSLVLKFVPPPLESLSSSAAPATGFTAPGTLRSSKLPTMGLCAKLMSCVSILKLFVARQALIWISQIPYQVTISVLRRNAASSNAPAVRSFNKSACGFATSAAVESAVRTTPISNISATHALTHPTYSGTPKTPNHHSHPAVVAARSVPPVMISPERCSVTPITTSMTSSLMSFAGTLLSSITHFLKRISTSIMRRSSRRRGME